MKKEIDERKKVHCAAIGEMFDCELFHRPIDQAEYENSARPDEKNRLSHKPNIEPELDVEITSLG